jgi:hypothetical protein
MRSGQGKVEPQKLMLDRYMAIARTTAKLNGADRNSQGPPSTAALRGVTREARTWDAWETWLAV